MMKPAYPIGNLERSMGLMQGPYECGVITEMHLEQSLFIDAPLTEKADVLLLGCSYYAFDMDEKVKTFLKENKDKIGKIACFGTSAMMKSMKKPMKKVLDEFGILLLEEEFHCHGSFGPMHKGKPDEADLKAAQEFAVRLLENN